MRKYFLTQFLFFAAISIYAQTDSLDVFTYLAPQFFSKTELQSGVQFNLINKDGSFCTITLCNSQPAKVDVIKDVESQWNKQVVKQWDKADKKPARVLTEQLWDGWVSTLAIGNFYRGKRKCIVMLNSFRKDRTTACAVFAFSDKLFKEPVENFSRNLHLKNR